MVFLEKVFSIDNDFSKEPSLCVVVIIGEGLVGSAVCDNFILQHNFQRINHFKLPWGQAQFKNKLQEVREYIQDRYMKMGSASPEGNNGYDHKRLKTIQLSFIWSAGRAGFGAAAQETDREEGDFEQFLQILHQIYENKLPSIKIDFHFISSAGGLFEGQSGVNENSIPQPLRPYGQLKWKQELRLREFSKNKNDYFCTIYRPSSIYGRISQGQRIGLITNMLQNGIMKKVTTITGDLYTLRDYIHSTDMAKIITAGILQPRKHDSISGDLLAVIFCLSQKPTTIYEIKSIIEFYLKHKIYIQLHFQPKNSKDITFRKMESPFGIQGRDIRLGIKDVLVHWYGANI